MPLEGFEPPTFASKAKMISPPALAVPSEGLEPPITGSKPVVISISPRGLGHCGQAFQHRGKNLGGQDFTTEALNYDIQKIEKKQTLR